MYLFTQDQVAWMHATLDGLRASIGQPDKGQAEDRAA
jgi:hypothetical protein